MKATLINNHGRLFVDPITNYSHIEPEIAENYKEIDFDGVNFIALKEVDEKLYIFLATGWSYDRGMFRDYYTI